ncbi:aminotransferase class I/II-fold pyridoxal phosphate-dependent enzyme [Okeanomitos corallinicola TIOX110]|uniref:Aminotransferase class I/II-fold pyridoxal phosphate-dependent enzyme n=1 Tax=Okeanomitos corallinicola TIOX110 TaxID=3133117 RepID=A0ABZ2UNQ1_9CYAN
MLNQNQTPLIDALKASISRPHSPFYTPGHKRGAGISPILTDLLGEDVLRADLTELEELDNLFTPETAILEAQELAADAFGAEKTYFLVNGSTCGIEAAIMSTCGTGDKIILPRNIHSSVISGLVLSGAMPIFIYPEYDDNLDIAHSIKLEDLKLTLSQHPDAKAVLTIHPTYYGVCGDLKSIAQITHEYNLPLIVDEAHGSHFGFHNNLPTSALVAGADITIQSIHKTLGAMTQASMLHIQGDKINVDRLNKALQLVQSTSPSFVLLASLDAARHQMAMNGESLMLETLYLAGVARRKINKIPGLSVLDIPDIKNSGFFDLDKTRLTVNVSKLGITGFAAEDFINENALTPEFSSLQNLIFIISLGNNKTDIEALLEGLKKLSQTSNLTNQYDICKYKNDAIIAHTLCISPREAFFADSETLPLEKTLDRICAENVCPYPPGIPVLMAGELITKAAIEYLQQIPLLGGVISGCIDSSLRTLKVIKT